MKFTLSQDERTIYKYRGSEKEIIIPEGIIVIDSEAFYKCKTLNNVVCPSTLKTIGKWAFGKCANFSSIIINNGLCEIGDYAFADCTSLNNIVLKDNLKSIGFGAFKGCSSLTTIVIPDSVEYIAPRVFENCTNLKTIVFGKGIKKIEDFTFWNCPSLQTIKIVNPETTFSKMAMFNCANAMIENCNGEQVNIEEPESEVRKTDKDAKPFDYYNAGLEQPVEGALYSINGVRGRHIDVFDNKCIIKTKVTIGSILTHNATDGAKTIYYADVVGVQFKEPGITIGYLQLETPGLTMNNAASNFFNENSFTFDTSVIETEKMREIAAYIESRVQEIKHPQPQQSAPAQLSAPFSVADELLKFKQLLDMGALTQEEFDAKKKELLGL